jgi:hypothetical protein
MESLSGITILYLFLWLWLLEFLPISIELKVAINDHIESYYYFYQFVIRYFYGNHYLLTTKITGFFKLEK